VTTLSVEDRAAVIDTCIRFAWCLDDRRWDDLAALFGTEIDADYTSLLGGEPATVTPDDMVAASHRLLGTIDASQHFVAGHVVTGDSDRAQCRSQVIATHTFAAARLGERIWTAGGSYTMDLARSGDRWQIVGLRFDLIWSTGNHEIVHQSRADARAKRST
jgi:hypothetical protein